MNFKKSTVFLVSVACTVFLVASVIFGVLFFQNRGKINDLQEKNLAASKALDNQAVQTENINAELAKIKEELSSSLENYNKLSKDYEELKKAKATSSAGGSGGNDTSGPKTIYLTFDDGPSPNTAKVLDILKKYGVKATFFVNGRDDAFSDTMYKRIVAEGHTLANHTYEHEYKTVYKSPEAFWASIDKNNQLIKKYTGKETKLMRFPGGSNNTVSKKGTMNILTSQAKAKGYIYYDWNVSSEDATAAVVDSEKIKNSVIKYATGRKSSIVLMHDAYGKRTTPIALDEVISHFKNKGYLFRPLDESVPPVQFLK